MPTRHRASSSSSASRSSRSRGCPVCVADEVPGPATSSSSRSPAARVIVCRNREGELRAFHNVCRHRGARLCDAGPGHAERFFKCPYHSWAYDLDGKCLGTPLFTADSEVPQDQRGIFDMSERQGVRQGRLRPAPGALRALGLPGLRVPRRGRAAAARRARRPSRRASPATASTSGGSSAGAEYEIPANWKLVAENFMEYYHLPWVHPSLVKVSPMDAHYRWQGTGKYVGFCTTPIAANTDDGGWLGLPAIDGLSEDDAVSARFAWLYPEHRAERACRTTSSCCSCGPGAAGLTVRDGLPAHPPRVARAGARRRTSTRSWPSGTR